MFGKHRVFLSWLIGACLIMGAFYAAVGWLWSAAEESRAASLEREVVSAVSNDLAEGNLFKLGATLSRLQNDGHIRFAEIRGIGEGHGTGFVYRTPGEGDPTDNAFSSFRCGEQRRIVAHSKNGVSLITALPSNIAGADCTALFISSDFPAELIRFKNRLTAAFSVLVALMFGFFFWFTTSWYQRILNIEVEKESAIRRVAAQVAHDIRSPLAALDTVTKDLARLPEDQRIVVRSAVGRIRDIANNLDEKHRQSRAASAESPAGTSNAADGARVELLSSHIEPLITEKRLQVRSKIGIKIEGRLDADSYGLFARIPPIEFERLLANLIQNGVEALDKSGSVMVTLSQENDWVHLSVLDDGRGISPEILPKLGGKGETFGKKGGSGLGLYHAKASVESWGGSLGIQSMPGQGTTVTIKLPQAPAPGWFVSRLELAPGSTVLVLDDDISIHQVWQGRFDAARIKEHGIQTKHFSAPAELREWVRDNAGTSSEALYLMDYELLGQPATGLNVIEELGLGAKAILVTSRFEEKAILAECQRLSVRMIPKGLAGFVPISIRAVVPAPDAVLLDDDALVHMTWRLAAKSKGINLVAFQSPKDFLAAVELLPKETSIYLDSDLGDTVPGEVIAKDLHARGFANLYLTTGHSSAALSSMPWIKKVLGKEPPWA